MKPHLLAALALLSGCTTEVSPGLREPYSTRADWKGQSCRVVAAAGAADVEGTPGAVTYRFPGRRWAEFLAECLAEDLEALGAARAEAPEVAVSLEGVALEDRAVSQASRAEVLVRARCGDFTRVYRGVHESQLNFPDAARRAAADALRQLVEDPALRAALAPR